MPEYPPRSSEPELAKDVEIHAPVPHGSGDAELARDVDQATGGAARELARAFQANAEALQSIHEVQATLATSLKRGDRSEMMLQSTQALNETFRNLTTIQRQMLTQMQEQQAATRRSPLVPMMLLGLLVVLLGGVYLIIDQLQEARPSMEELARVRDENEQGRLEAYRDGEARGMEAAGSKLASLEDEVDRSRLRVHALESERDAARADVEELEREKRAVETERNDLADRVVKAQNEAMARKLVEDTAREHKADLVVAKARLDQLEADLERERARNERLLKQVAAYGLLKEEPLIDVRYPDREAAKPDATPPPTSLPATPAPASDVPPATPPATPTAEPVDLEDLPGPEAPVASPAVPGDDLGAPPTGPGDLPAPRVRSPDGGPAPFPPPAPNRTEPADAPAPEGPKTQPVPVDWRRDLNRDAVLTGRIRSVVNRLLDAGSQTTRSRSEWQLTKLGGVTQDVLGDVMLLQYDNAGRLIGNLSAQEMRIIANRDTKVVTLVLKTGKRVFDRRAEPLPEQGVRLIVAKGEEHVRAWRNSGLVMIHDK
ncbi:MAG: hypothetical protein QNJ98_08265 [Planctomycetota bacterium]|nr:hypothetical protein [Planctomycetota bacterium]